MEEFCFGSCSILCAILPSARSNAAYRESGSTEASTSVCVMAAALSRYAAFLSLTFVRSSAAARAGEMTSEALQLN